MPSDPGKTTVGPSKPALPATPPPAPSDRYDESQIQVLEGIEHVRLRPAMYIGEVGLAGLHHLVYEVVDNSIDEAMAGYCKNILVHILADSSCVVRDDGRGIPVGPMRHESPQFDGKPAVEIVMTTLGAGGKFQQGAYKVSGGLHGIGVSVVNALAERMTVEVSRDGKLYATAFERGQTVRPLSVIGDSSASSTRIEFKPDSTIFPDVEFRYEALQARLRELAYLNEGVTIELVDDRTGRSDRFCYQNGLAEYIQYLNRGKELVHKDPVVLNNTDPDQRLVCRIALQYNTGYHENILCFANNIHNVDGGSHMTGFKSALTRTLNAYARSQNLIKGNITPTGEDFREGLTAAVSVLLPDPKFEAQTKVRLQNPEAESFVERTLNEQFGNWLEEHPADAKRIVQRGVQAAQARVAAQRAREIARKSVLSSAGMTEKLVDCSSRDPEATELFLVEGDSAGGSAKGGRDNRTQAILPLRGKILNVERARIDKVLGHEEIASIIQVIGCGVGTEDFDVKKRRYGKIIIMTDADVDGSHIRTLLLTFFFRQMLPLIADGRVYIAQPPLFQLGRGKRAEYVLDDRVLNDKLTEWGLEGSRLEVRPPGREVRTLTGQALRDLVELVEGIQTQARILRRRGIHFGEFVNRYRLPDTGRLPVIRALLGADEHYFYNEEEFLAFRQQAADRLQGVDAEDAAGIATPGEGPAEGVRPRLVRQELGECRTLEQLLGRLGGQGFELQDLFARRVENVAGEKPPARFVLHDEKDRPLEVDNLQEVVTGVRQIGSAGVEVKRFKGLGEMNPEELWETTMDPERRSVLKVVISDEADDPEQFNIDTREADRIFSILMGEDVEARRDFIESNAIHVKNLDI